MVGRLPWHLTVMLPVWARMCMQAENGSQMVAAVSGGENWGIVATAGMRSLILTSLSLKVSNRVSDNTRCDLGRKPRRIDNAFMPEILLITWHINKSHSRSTQRKKSVICSKSAWHECQKWCKAKRFGSVVLHLHLLDYKSGRGDIITGRCNVRSWGLQLSKAGLWFSHEVALWSDLIRSVIYAASLFIYLIIL